MIIDISLFSFICDSFDICLPVMIKDPTMNLVLKMA